MKRLLVPFLIVALTAAAPAASPDLSNKPPEAPASPLTSYAPFKPFGAIVMNRGIARYVLARCLHDMWRGTVQNRRAVIVEGPVSAVQVGSNGFQFYDTFVWGDETETSTAARSWKFAELPYITRIFGPSPFLISLHPEEQSADAVTINDGPADQHLLWTSHAEALNCADALNWMIAEAHGALAPESSDGATFAPAAATWRALPVKPQLPEAVHGERVLAENAVAEHDVLGAITHYRRGLQLYPTWPEAWFNAAVLFSQIGAYSDAVDFMNHYLQLTPEAADAQQARDQVVIWKDKASQQGDIDLLPRDQAVTNVPIH